MPTRRKDLKQELTRMVDNLEWAVTHIQRVSMAFDSYTEEMVSTMAIGTSKPAEDTLERYLSYSTMAKEIEVALVNLIDIINRFNAEL